MNHKSRRRLVGSSNGSRPNADAPATRQGREPNRPIRRIPSLMVLQAVSSRDPRRFPDPRRDRHFAARSGSNSKRGGFSLFAVGAERSAWSTTVSTMEGSAGVDASLAERFRDRDPDAIREVYRQYGRLVYGVAYRALGNQSFAEEASQQTFLQAWRASATVDASRELGPWLCTIARRAAIDVYRREARRVHDDVTDVAADNPAVMAPPPNIEGISQSWEIRSAVDELPADEREVVRLQHFGGLTHQEIADQLTIPVGTVKSRSHRAHRRLAARLGHLQEVST